MARRRRKIRAWIKKTRQRGGFIFSIGAIIAAISAAASAAAPAVATGAISAAAGYAATKLLEKVGGQRRAKPKKIVKFSNRSRRLRLNK
jgi:predicted ABC-type transport system involved in lysophospholipase L1 biosynthesis ATPase subunit